MDPSYEVMCASMIMCGSVGCACLHSKCFLAQIITPQECQWGPIHQVTRHWGHIDSFLFQHMVQNQLNPALYQPAYHQPSLEELAAAQQQVMQQQMSALIAQQNQHNTASMQPQLQSPLVPAPPPPQQSSSPTESVSNTTTVLATSESLDAQGGTTSTTTATVSTSCVK